MVNTRKLRQSLEDCSFFMLPGIYDCLGAKIAESVGFSALYLSGGAYSIAGIGRPDLGFLNRSDVLDVCRRIVSTVNIPLITDTDNSFGNASQAADIARQLEQIGVAGMQMDDDILPQQIPSRIKEVLPWNLMAPKLKAARQNVSKDFVIIMRTMVGKFDGMLRAAERANRSMELGVDYVFIDGINSMEDLELVAKHSEAKLILNLNENMFPATLDIGTIQSMGFRIGLYPVSTLQIAAHSYYLLFRSLKSEYSTMSHKEEMIPTSVLQDIMGLNDIIKKLRSLYE